MQKGPKTSKDGLPRICFNMIFVSFLARWRTLNETATLRLTKNVLFWMWLFWVRTWEEDAWNVIFFVIPRWMWTPKPSDALCYLYISTKQPVQPLHGGLGSLIVSRQLLLATVGLMKIETAFWCCFNGLALPKSMPYHGIMSQHVFNGVSWFPLKVEGDI